MANNEEWPSETRYVEYYEAPAYESPSLGSQIVDFFKSAAGTVVGAATQMIPSVVGALFQSKNAPEQQQVNPPPEASKQTKGAAPYNPVVKGGYEPTPKVTFNIADLFKTPLIWIILGLGFFLIILTQRR